jgi:tetratricopeptide (TPR) repeat protein
MQTDLVALCAELERLFELDELKKMSRDVLGVDPDTLGGSVAKGSFVKALTERCVESDAIVALCDAMTVARSDLDPRVAELRSHGLHSADELELGDQFGPYLVLRRLGRGRLGSVYLARSGSDDVRLKVLRREATYDRTGLQRFLAASRLVGSVEHAGLPGPVSAGQIEGRFYVAHRYVEGQTLAARVAKTGAMHVDEARSMLQGILEALGELHAKRLVHGSLRLENVLLGTKDDGSDVVVLLDAGAYHLTAAPGPANGRSDRLASIGSYKAMSPEQIEGRLPDAKSDLYSFGAVLYEVLTGRPVFEGQSAAEAFMAHLTREPRLPSRVAPAGWAGPDVDDLVTQLLNKNASFRPMDTLTVAAALDGLGTESAPEILITDEELEERVSTLLGEPTSATAAERLHAALREGGSAARIAEALRLATNLVDADSGPEALAALERLLERAAKLYATNLKDPEAAEPLYARLAELRPADEEVARVLERLRRHLGKHEEIVEALLARCEVEEDAPKKAALWAQIGRVYVSDLGDADQGLVAFTQSFLQEPTPAAALEVERHAKSGTAWEDVLSAAAEVENDERPEAAQQALLLQMARWYETKLARPALALPYYSKVLATNPTHDGALDGVANVYRKAQQWGELASALLVRADAPQTAAPHARDLRVEAAELLETKLGAPDAARELYERVLEDDPTHKKAGEALVDMYEKAGDFPRFVKALEGRASAFKGDERSAALFRIAEATELYIKDLPEAIRRYELVVADNPKHVDALHGLDRCYSQAGRFKDLVKNLQQQIAVAATPRQKITLWERVAAVWDEEFLDHSKAAEAWENVLDLDAENDSALTNLSRHYRALERWNDLVLILERHLELLRGDRMRQIEKALGLGHVLSEGLRVPERAIAAYERALSLDPGNSEALEALARLRVNTGETHGAVSAIEQLAHKAHSAVERAEHFIRAAQILEARGDQDGAIERYKLAVEANPRDRSAALILRAAYVARGDVNAAAELLEHEIKQTESETTRAKLAGEMASLCRDRLKNDTRAETWAKLALGIDPTNLDALRVMGEVAFDDDRYVEAARYFEQVANRTDALSQADAVRVLTEYSQCLVKNGAEPKALEVAQQLLKVAPDSPEVISRVSELIFEHGEPQESFELHWQLKYRLPSDAGDDFQARIRYRLGESARRVGDLGAAEGPLEEAASLEPESTLALKSLVQLYLARESWDLAIRTLYRQLECETGDARAQVLLDIGDIASERLHDASFAAKSYMSALGERPNDRRVLTKLMQLYSAEKDWDRLVKVVLKLADFVDDDKQKAKYMHTAGRIAWKEMNDAKLGSQLFSKALELDPENESAVKDAVDVHTAANNAEALKEALKRQVKLASDAGDHEQMLRSLTTLADLYLRRFKRLDQAIAVYEAAEEIDPDNIERKEILARLYASDASRYRDKAFKTQLDILDKDPFRPETHKALRVMHTEAQQPDAAWCCCQALYVLGQADKDEERFYMRMRNEEGIQPKARLTEPDFHSALVHKDADPLLTALFTVIQPAVMAARSKSLQQLGYGPELLIDPSLGQQFASTQIIPYVADVLGMPCPPLFQNPEDLGELSFLHAQHPSIVVGTAVVGVALPLQTMSFMSARHLTYYRQGLYVRHLVPTTTGLKAWLFAAMRLMTPQFPVPPDIQGAVQEALVALDRVVTAQQRDHLARVVSKLVQEGTALDLKKWVSGIDLTADRAGLLMSDDLATAVEMVRAADPASSSVTPEQRVEEIYKYAVSDQYFAARKALGIAIGS